MNQTIMYAFMIVGLLFMLSVAAQIITLAVIFALTGAAVVIGYQLTRRAIKHGKKKYKSFKNRWL